MLHIESNTSILSLKSSSPKDSHRKTVKDEILTLFCHLAQAQGIVYVKLSLCIFSLYKFISLQLSTDRSQIRNDWDEDYHLNAAEEIQISAGAR